MATDLADAIVKRAHALHVEEMRPLRPRLHVTSGEIMLAAEFASDGETHVTVRLFFKGPDAAPTMRIRLRRDDFSGARQVLALLLLQLPMNIQDGARVRVGIKGCNTDIVYTHGQDRIGDSAITPSMCTLLSVLMRVW